MPRYNYKCDNCGEIVELFGKYEETQKCLICKNCCGSYHEEQASIFKRIFSPSKNFILKGPGWGKDNYCKEKKDKSKESK